MGFLRRVKSGCNEAVTVVLGPQVDLGVAKTVRGVITQGARGGDAAGGATADNNRAFVRKYKVAHSVNAKDWNFIMDSKTSLPKVGGLLLMLFVPEDVAEQKTSFLAQVFEGNTHYDTPELRHFEETVAQYVRIYPERWSPAGIGMRVEILGCDLPGRTSKNSIAIYMIICGRAVAELNCLPASVLPFFLRTGAT